MDIKEYIDPAIKIGIIALIVLYTKKIARIWAGPDGKFSTTEFGRFMGLILFGSMGVYMIIKEGSREHEWQIYGELYILIVFTSLLAILHLDTVMDKVVRILEIMLQFRKGIKTEKKDVVD